MKQKELIRAANDHGDLVLPTESEAKAGILCAANESSFNQSYFSEALTTFMVGWKDNDDLEGFLEFIAPEVECGRRFEYKKAVNAEAMLSESDDVRAIDADFKEVKFSGETALGITQNKGLTLIVDLDRVAGIPNWEQRYAAWLWRRLLRNVIRRAVSGLTTAATSVAKEWKASSDPDADMMDAIDLGGDSVGINPTRAIIGKTAWAKRFKAYRTADNIRFASSTLTPQQVADLLGLQTLRVCTERYQSAASTKSKIVGDVALFFTAESGMLPDDSSSIKRFRSNVEGGGKMRIYRHERSSKLVALSVEHYSNIIATAGGVRGLSIT